jgi:hypothetical protein
MPYIFFLFLITEIYIYCASPIKGGDSTRGLSFLSKMSRQLQARKSLLIIGDSNVERNILHTGRLYCEQAESVPARNQGEYQRALKSIQPNQHKLVVFAMLTNLVVNAGNASSSTALSSWLTSIESFLSVFIKDLT